MVDINAIERALLLNVVRLQNWNILILNDITEEYFSIANKPLYRYIKDYVDNGKYPDLQIICFNFEISDDELALHLSIEDLKGLCDTLKTEYLREELIYKLKGLNDKQDEIYKNPIGYVESMGAVYDELKTIGYQNKSVDLFDKIENILTLDPTDVISTGFKELDDKLIGWKRGEELVTIIGRTRSR